MSWVLVKSFGSRAEAELAKGLLSTRGIECHIQADDVAGLRPHLALTLGVKLLVHAEDLEAAKRLLETDESRWLDEDDGPE